MGRAYYTNDRRSSYFQIRQLTYYGQNMTRYGRQVGRQNLGVQISTLIDRWKRCTRTPTYIYIEGVATAGVLLGIYNSLPSASWLLRHQRVASWSSVLHARQSNPDHASPLFRPYMALSLQASCLLDQQVQNEGNNPFGSERPQVDQKKKHSKHHRPHHNVITCGLHTRNWVHTT